MAIEHFTTLVNSTLRLYYFYLVAYEELEGVS